MHFGRAFVQYVTSNSITLHMVNRAKLMYGGFWLENSLFGSFKVVSQLTETVLAV